MQERSTSKNLVRAILYQVIRNLNLTTTTATTTTSTTTITTITASAIVIIFSLFFVVGWKYPWRIWILDQMYFSYVVKAVSTSMINSSSVAC